jgi:tripartite-type tricarboxylate transporter receptor subunit TctC
VPYAAGGSTDLTARLIAKSLSNALGQSVIVDNRAGAGGTIGHDIVAKAAPDGYTILFSAAGPLVVSPNTYAKLNYDPLKSFDPVILICNPTPLIGSESRIQRSYSLADLLKEAKDKKGNLNYGSFGNGSAAHLAAESFKIATKTEMVHVPYKGSSPALAALMAGEIDLMFDVFSTAAAFAKADKLRAIAISSKERSPQFPDVPTLDQAGVTGIDAGTWFGCLYLAERVETIVDQVK